MALPFNIETFKDHRFESDSHGDLLCPSGQCSMKFNPGGNEDGAHSHGLSLQVKQQIWAHVYEAHDDLFPSLQAAHQATLRSSYTSKSSKVQQALQLASDSHLKVSQQLIKLALGESDEKEAVGVISNELKALNTSLAELLLSTSSNNTVANTVL